MQKMDTSKYEDCVQQNRTALREFQPTVCCGFKFGAALLLDLMRRGDWVGPSLLIAPAVVLGLDDLSASLHCPTLIVVESPDGQASALVERFLSDNKAAVSQGSLAATAISQQRMQEICTNSNRCAAFRRKSSVWLASHSLSRVQRILAIARGTWQAQSTRATSCDSFCRQANGTEQRFLLYHSVSFEFWLRLCSNSRSRVKIGVDSSLSRSTVEKFSA